MLFGMLGGGGDGGERSGEDEGMVGLAFGLVGWWSLKVGVLSGFFVFAEPSFFLL